MDAVLRAWREMHGDGPERFLGAPRPAAFRLRLSGRLWRRRVGTVDAFSCPLRSQTVASRAGERISVRFHRITSIW